jgi:metal-dependent amidase/aminoacylase/carboxypeptidase family protein
MMPLETAICMLMTERIKTLSKNIAGTVIDYRRHLHAHPELSFKEYNTSDFIKQKLTELNIYWQPMAGTGIIGIIK